MNSFPIIRNATINDAERIVRFIQDLASYEKLSHECKADAALITHWLFGDTPRAYCLIAKVGAEPAGFALYFYNFSTFMSRPGIYIEDVYVDPAFRRRGIAKALFATLAQKVIDEGCGRLEWSVLDWNTPAIDFYASLGAVPMREWIIQRMTGESLVSLASYSTSEGDGA